MTNAAIKVPFPGEDETFASRVEEPSARGPVSPISAGTGRDAHPGSRSPAPSGQAAGERASWEQIRDYLFFKRPSPEVIREWARKVAARQRALEISRGEDEPEWQLNPSCRYGICRDRTLAVHLRPDGRGRKLAEMTIGQVYRVTARSASGSWLQVYVDDKKVKGWIEASRHIFITVGEYKLLKSADAELAEHFVRALVSSIPAADGDQRLEGARALLRLDACGSNPSPV